VKNKVAIVTGVANPYGMGYGSAKALAREGAVLAVTDITEYVHDRCEDLKGEGFKVSSFQADLVDSSKVNEIVEKVIAKYGKVDILVNAAGLAGPFLEKRRQVAGDFDKIAEDDYDFVVDINLKTTFNCIKAVLPDMLKRKYGRIVNISSVTGPQVCGPVAGGYTAAKAAVCGLTKTLALEVAAYNITINSILPGWIYTDKSTASYGEPETLRRVAFNRSIPMKRLGDAWDCGEIVVFLSSDESSYLTGLELIFDGGNVIQEMKLGPAFPYDL
jgi:3-oxoacyl-[acyl-carrier protein] reductase